MAQEIIDANDPTRYAYVNYIDDVWNSQRWQYDKNYPIMLTCGYWYDDNHGGMSAEDKEIRLTLVEAEQLLAQLQRDIAAAKKDLT